MAFNAKRRNLIQFFGYSVLAGKQSNLIARENGLGLPTIKGIARSNHDDLLLADGLSHDILLRWRDRINPTEQFGFNNDFIALIEENESDGILWVNHEYVHPLFISSTERTNKNVDLERKEVGGSILRVKQNNGRWKFIENDKINKRIDGTTKIPFSLNTSIKNSRFAEGTVGNCGGGVTPWGTFLSCEENYKLFYGEHKFQSSKYKKSRFKWEKFYPNPPEHYGWVVEINPHSQTAKKHITLGRFAHESATCVLSKQGNTVVYSGDDKNNEYLYKFVADRPNTLTSGNLYVADTINGKWLALDWEHNKVLKEHFKNQTEVYTYARHAAKLLGGTPLDRPEDIKINPITGDIFMALTNNVPRANFHGQILKITENKGDYESLEFSVETFLTGGDSGFSSPDNLVFDRNGNLWFCSDISGKAMRTPPYTAFKNNGLFIVPAHGPQSGHVIQLASAPNDAELTGLCFDSAQTTLFVSVQHPGETTKDLNAPTSHWPSKKGLPASAVVQIHGPLLESITNS